MFQQFVKHVQITRDISVEPHLFSCNLRRLLKDKVWRRIQRVCTSDFGFVLRLVDIDEISEGFLDPDTGSIIYQVKFTVVAFKPSPNDIVIAEVQKSNESGFFARIGPLEIIVPQVNIPDTYECDIEGQWRNDDGEVVVEPDSYVKIRVCIIRKRDKSNMSFYENDAQPDPNGSPPSPKPSQYLGGVLFAIGELVE